MSTLWKVACKEDEYPGMWQRWFKNQCVAVGFAAEWGYKLNGPSDNAGWSACRNAIKEMKPGDYVIVALKGNRVGRIGEITGKRIEDSDWNPLVPVGPDMPDGEMGRRILVRWDMTVGPDNEDLVVQLPEGACFSRGILRRTASRITSMSLKDIQKVMNDPTNWVSLLGSFKYEKALSDYIANYPNRLEDGLLPHPNSKIRERVWDDMSRADVVLIDKQNQPVIVECKQHAPTIDDIEQLRHYMKRMKEKTGEMPRGILVHGGPMKLQESVFVHSLRKPMVELVSYSLDVHFRPSHNGPLRP